RQPGLLGLALAEPTLSAEIIADGIHVHPMLVDAFLRLKPAGKAILVSEGISAAGCGEGDFQLGSISVQVAGGRCESGGILAGSVLTLEKAIQNVMQFSRLDLASAIPLASLNPAELMGWNGAGRLQTGSPANFTVFHRTGDLLACYLAGQPVN
ncbi:MAG: amidohydrolase family protein, partial [Terriglobales bacterium]